MSEANPAPIDKNVATKPSKIVMKTCQDFEGKRRHCSQGSKGIQKKGKKLENLGLYVFKRRVFQIEKKGAPGKAEDSSKLATDRLAEGNYRLQCVTEKKTEARVEKKLTKTLIPKSRVPSAYRGQAA